MELTSEKCYHRKMTNFLSKYKLHIELLVVFGLFPAIISFIKPHIGVVLIIWTVSAAAWRILRQHGYTWREEWNFSAVNKANIMPIMWRFLPYSIAILIFTWGIIPDKLFSLPLERPLVWVMVMTLYPLLSVIPQEIIFRSFFLKRYEGIIPASRMRTANALSFGWVHIIMQNWIAVSFCIIGGWLFSDTYKKSKSLAVVSFEHALYGCFIFTIGLGVFFYHGNVK